MTHPFDAACMLTPAAEGRFTGQTPDAYWNMAGPFGGTTAAVLLRAMQVQQPADVEPVALTVNYSAPLARGGFEIAVREIRSGKSVRYVSAELQQGSTIAATATAVFALRRDTWAHQVAAMPEVPPPEAVPLHDLGGPLPWLQRYEFRFVCGAMQPQAQPHAQPQSAHSVVWLADTPPRPLDHLSLTALCDTFFVRLFQVRGTLVPAGTVTMTVHFHGSAADIAAQGAAPVLGVADAHTITRNFGDQTGQIWSSNGRLLATTTQMAWFKQ